MDNLHVLYSNEIRTPLIIKEVDETLFYQVQEAKGENEESKRYVHCYELVTDDYNLRECRYLETKNA